MAVAEASVSVRRIVGIGFAATSSLVALDARDRPVSLSANGNEARNVIVCSDQRAREQVARISNLERGGVTLYVSQETQWPRLLWIKEKLSSAWIRAARYFDLADFLTYRATHSDARSLSTTMCRWNYSSTRGFDREFARSAGLDDLFDTNFSKIGAEVRELGTTAGLLTERSARELGLVSGIPVAMGGIDAHVASIGSLGVPSATQAGIPPHLLETRMSMMANSTTRHLVVSQRPKRIPGFGAPNDSAVIPGMWLSETSLGPGGNALEFVVASHPRGSELFRHARSTGGTPFDELNHRIEELEQPRMRSALEMTRRSASILEILRNTHVLFEQEGDCRMRATISGLAVDDSFDSLAGLYLAGIHAIAHETRRLAEAVRNMGGAIDTILANGNLAKNTLFLKECAEVTACQVVTPSEFETTLLGAAILGAVGMGQFSSIREAMAAMTQPGRNFQPATGKTAEFHSAKHKVFLRMQKDRGVYRDAMSTGVAEPPALARLR